MTPFLSNAQTNYKPGYVVTLKGDTLKGYIDYREWDITPEIVNFKISLDSPDSHKYTVDDIGYFEITHLESFVTYNGPVSTNDTDPNHIGIGRDTSYKNVTVFLKILQKGNNAVLYSYSDKIKARFFIGERPDYKPRELIFRITKTTNDLGVTNTTNENTYRKQLSAVAVKNNEFNHKLEIYIGQSEYTEDGVLGIVSQINHINKTEFERARNTMSPHRFFVGGGLDITSTLPDGQHQFTATGEHTSVLPVISGGIDVFANPNTRRLLFRFELMAATGSYNTYYYHVEAVSFNIVTISVVPQVIYYIYNGSNFKLFGGVGLGLNDYIYAKGAYNPQSFDSSGMLQAGVQLLNRYELYVHYLQDGRGSADTQFGLKYLFK